MPVDYQRATLCALILYVCYVLLTKPNELIAEPYRECSFVCPSATRDCSGEWSAPWCAKCDKCLDAHTCLPKEEVCHDSYSYDHLPLLLRFLVAGYMLLVIVIGFNLCCYILG